jgi:hypothetical protein
MRVQFDSVVFAYDFDRLTDGGLLYDHGPLGLHATPGAGAAAPTRQLDGSYSFDGGDYFELSGASQARFYANAPTGACTWLSLGYATQGAIWSCFDGANMGLIYLHVGNKIRLYQCQGGPTPYVATASSSMMDGRYRVVAAAIEAAPRCLIEQASDAAVWVGAFGATSYNTAMVPTIGAYPGGGSSMTGRQKYLCLLRGAVSSSDMAELSALLSNGVKPFCVRT